MKKRYLHWELRPGADRAILRYQMDAGDALVLIVHLVEAFNLHPDAVAEAVKRYLEEHGHGHQGDA